MQSIASKDPADSDMVKSLRRQVSDLMKAKDHSAEMAAGLQEQVLQLQQHAHGTEARIADMVDDLEALRG